MQLGYHQIVITFSHLRRKLLATEVKNQILFWFLACTNPIYRRLVHTDIAFLYVEHPVIVPFIVRMRQHLGTAIHFVGPNGDFSRYRKVIVMNGLWDSLKPAADEIAEDKKLYCEIGFLPQTKNVYFDPQGVHGHSSIRDITLEPLDDQQQRQLEAFRARFIEGNFVRVKWGSLDLSGQDGEDTANRYNFDFVFVPLQLESDTAFQLCPFRSNQEIITYIENALPGKKVIFKAHPQDPNDNYQVSGDNILLPVDNTELRPLLVNCSAVVACNSTVILEALMLGKRCATFGRGFTTNHHITLECHDDTTRLSGLEQWTPEQWKVDSFLYALMHRQFGTDFDKDPEEILRLRSYMEAQDLL